MENWRKNKPLQTWTKKEEYGEGALKEGWKIWNKWDTQRKQVRQQVAKDKKQYIQKCIQSVGTPDGPENIWKAIDLIAPRSHKNSRALEKENGEICNTQEEEMEAVKDYCVRHLGQEEQTNATEKKEEESEENAEEKTHEKEEIKPLRAEVREAFRHTHHTKSTPEWSIPTKMYVVAEEQLVRPIQQMWKKWEKRTYIQLRGKSKKQYGYQNRETKETKFTKEGA